MIDKTFLPIFLEEAAEILSNWEATCLELDNLPTLELLNSLFRDVHTLKGSSKSVGLSAFGDYVHKIEDVLSLLKSEEIEWSEEISKTIFDSQGILENWVENLHDDPEYESDVSQILVALDSALDTNVSKSDVNASESEVNVSESETEASQGFGIFGDEENEAEESQGFGIFDDEESEENSANEKKDIGEILYDEGKVSTEQLAETSRLQSRKFGEILVETGAVTDNDVVGALDKQKKMRHGKTGSKSLKVSEEQLDKVVKACGELTILQSLISHFSDLKDYENESYQNAVALASSTVNELQETVLSLRMQPLNSLFQRMTRVAKDISRDVDKKIEFTTDGQEVELDKTIVDQLQDPLMHIVRNAIDHGIEGDRTGKDPKGNVRLSAKNLGSEVQIIVEDDGNGIDPQIIRAKAVEKKLISASASLTDDEIYQLILLPGFSTAQEVTAISGRGVGMDVVKTTIENIEGEVKIESEKGHGTKFLLSLPTSIGILDAMIIGVGEEKYALPLTEVSELINLSEHDITMNRDANQMFSLRNEIVPIEKLSSFLCPPGKPSKENKTELAVLSERNGMKLALTIDSFHGTQTVVTNNLYKCFSAQKGVSSTTILSNGEPGLVVSLAEVTKSYFANFSHKHSGKTA